MRTTIAVLALDAVVPLDLAIPAQVFGNYEEAPYRVTVCAAAPGPVATTAGFAVVADAGLEALATPTPCSSRASRRTCACPTRAVLDALRAAHARGARMVSICTGAFALAAAGVLDGRRATTHWRDARRPRRPLSRASASSRTCSTSTRATSSPPPASPPGSTSACTSCAATTAPRSPTGSPAGIVVPPHRDGGQAQYVDQPLPDARRRLARRHPRLGARAPRTSRSPSARLAAHAHVSERTFARRFTAETGVPVLRWLLAQRVDAARAALESTDASDRRDRRHAAASARRRTCASTSAATSRTTPTAYRRTFAP